MRMAKGTVQVVRGQGTTIRARVPLRLGLAGGGTDLSPYCDVYGGAVLNTTIDRYAYAFVSPSENGQIHCVATDIGVNESYVPERIDEVLSGKATLRIHAGVVAGISRRFHIVPEALRIVSFVDAPPGSGLGSSSALVVALVEAVAAFFQLPLGPYDIAHLAYEIERVDLDLAGGKQDQYAGTFGGTNFIEFLANDRVIVNPLRISEPIRNEVETSLVIAFTGISRSSADIIAQQRSGLVEASDTAIENMHRLKQDAHDMKDALLRGDIPHMARILNQSWEAKKNTAKGISNPHIETLHNLARAEGAIGAKVSGAGGGGFMMLIVPPERRMQVIQSLNAAGAVASGVHLVAEGAETWRT
ncbi:dehydrogenase [Acetobacter musti]|uniref:Dehydrogenase n=1 Tax=Acetobacter musti TaxID=864732 RepID=A0ABX0JUV0_9PROT|nr:GHMP kinase [Acetobacter musti]NHN86599.1 dehydrogenase [Acetobacter musti]